MKFLSYLMIYSAICGNYSDLFNFLESYRIMDDEKSARTIKRNFPKVSPIPYSNLDKSYLLRKYQDRHAYNLCTRMPYNGLQRQIKNYSKRILGNEKIEKERKIKEAFSRKITNKTRQKRHSHHSNKRYL